MLLYKNAIIGTLVIDRYQKKHGHSIKFTNPKQAFMICKDDITQILKHIYEQTLFRVFHYIDWFTIYVEKKIILFLSNTL